jgi:hypothetical protein
MILLPGACARKQPRAPDPRMLGLNLGLQRGGFLASLL